MDINYHLAPAGGPAATAAPGKAAEEKKPEKKEEEADVDMGGLFGDEYWEILTIFPYILLSNFN